VSLSVDQITILLQQEFKSLSAKLVSQDYKNAIDDTTRETGWSLPVSGNEKEFWFKRRAKRHLFYMLLTESAHKFKFESINLQQRFEHYRVLIRDEDREWVNWSEANVHLLAGANARELFGTVVHGGFQYDMIGQDTTYSTDNEVEVNPNDND
jgi:hypothetical protein